MVAIPGNFLSATTESVDPNTSGWKAKLNCTIALGSGGRNGDGLLKLTSSASGEMQAVTVASYPVTPGVLYWTFADAAGATVPERIGIRWMKQTTTWPATMTEVSITWSLTTATASSSLHRISVAGAAPATATHAQIVVSATPAAGGVINYFENVYFGFPLRTPGNLLSFNAESGGELDASAWGVGSNCSISRVAPMVPWSVDNYLAGGEEIALTVTANGDANILCVERPAVTEGVDYAAYCYLNPPTSGSSVWVELRFYDSGGSQIQATRSTLAAPGTGWYRQIASDVAPAGAVAASVAIGITSGTAGQVVRSEGVFLGDVATASANTKRTGNVLPHKDWDFEQGVSAWTVASGVATIARSTPWGAQSAYDFYSLTVSSSTATTSVIRSGKYSVTELLNWRLEAYEKVTAGGWTWIMRVRWFDVTDTLISTSSTSSSALPTPNWWSLSADFTAPAGAVTGQVQFDVTATSGSSTLQLDRVALWEVLPLTEVAADDATASVRIVLRELEPGDLITVYRVLADGSRTLVRGPDGLLNQTAITADSMVIEDYEAPLGVPVRYRIEMTDSDGLSGPEDRDSETVTLDPGDRNYVWLKDPAQPQLNLRVMVKTAPAWKQPIEQQQFRVRGRTAPVVISDVRASREGDLVAWTQSDTEREALRFLLASGNVLLWQSAPGMGESDVYVSVAEVAFPRVSDYAPEPLREWTLPLTEVDMPTGGLAGSATWTVQDVLVENATVASLLDRYATVLDLLLDQRTT